MPAPTEKVPGRLDEDGLRSLGDKALPADSVARMSREDLRDLVLSLVSDQRIAVAMREALTSQRIFSDIEGVTTSMTPFRVSSKEQLQSLVESFSGALSNHTQLVVAVAVVETERYRPFGKAT